MKIHPDVQDIVERTPLIDTHEHLIEESVRVSGAVGEWFFPCNDWSYLFWHYAIDDLQCAGMSNEARDKFFSPNTDLEEKWHIFAPWWERMKNTGYAQAVRLSIHKLYGEDDLTKNNFLRINEKILKMVRKGYYEEIIRKVCNIESCQVQTLQNRLFIESEYPTLLFQDMNFTPMSTRLDLEWLTRERGMSIHSLKECHKVIDWFFERYGHKAVAVKNYAAYDRRLNYEPVREETATPLFDKFLKEKRLPQKEFEVLQNHLFFYCVQKATDLQLPVKLHTGYYSGNGTMLLERVRQNASDLCYLFQQFPKTKFVPMHIGYPYQDEFIALAKHYPNVYIDMCWAWIISPLASVRFLKEFLLTAPASKLFTFGGDYAIVEVVYGHSRMARQGIAQALSELVEEKWLSMTDALNIVPRIMHDNAYEVFRIANKENNQ